ncbi:MAG TPA: DUF2934 domain-containing protein [Bryobacteraceae bacterium]|nr:DUF2934 domain-containing protein [Bryobacteraceae bacterium]
MGATGELWNAYRATWEAFSRNLANLQRCAETGQRNLIETALLEVERARSAHNTARDRLAATLALAPASPVAGTPELPEEWRVRETAHLIWELSGRPQGSAETDWLSAERLVRTAASA